MNVEEFYKKAGGNYDEIKSRLPTDDLIKKFVLMLPNDPCYSNLLFAMEAGDCKAAFAACHTLKGVAANLALKTLYTSAAALTEDLRSGTPAPSAQKNFAQVKKDFEAVVNAINEGGLQ